MKARQASLPLKTETPKESWSYHLIGGWSGYSQFIPETDVPLCKHDHKEPIPPAFKKKHECHFDAFLARWCLTKDWQGHKAGSEVITYGTLGTGRGIKVDLWVKESCSPISIDNSSES